MHLYKWEFMGKWRSYLYPFLKWMLLNKNNIWLFSPWNLRMWFEWRCLNIWHCVLFSYAIFSYYLLYALRFTFTCFTKKNFFLGKVWFLGEIKRFAKTKWLKNNFVKNYVELIDLRLCSNPNHKNLVQKRLSLYQLLSPFLLAYLSSDALSLPLHQNYFLSKRGDIRPPYKTILNT